MRYELKYLIRRLDYRFLESLILGHSKGFRKTYPDRQVNNIYYDSPDFRVYHQNLEGELLRKKMRTRWYGRGALQGSTPVLEIKCKNGMLGWKESYPMRK